MLASNVRSASQNARMRCSISGRFGCESTLGYATGVPFKRCRLVGGSQGRAGARGTTLLTGSHGPRSLAFASVDGLDPLGSSDGAEAPRSSEDSEVMASSTSLQKMLQPTPR